jgi:uncharacterized membrane protein
MKTNTIPAIIMLTAGCVACVAGIASHMEIVAFTKMLLVVLLIFYILGCIVKVILDKNFKEMQKEETTDGEDLLEEEAEDAEQGKEEVEEEKVQE